MESDSYSRPKIGSGKPFIMKPTKK